MYSTCIFCHSSLGKNEAIEQFPIGRKLAFDGAKGRLWAVCAKCGRWNLTPIEERWEAIEECERQFRSAFQRSSTDQIGLARIREGTDLIRIGEPLRPEFAAWRYGRFFQRRRKMVYAATGVAIVGSAVGVIVGGAFSLVPSVAAVGLSFANRQSETIRARKFIRYRVQKDLGRKIWQHERVSIRIIPSQHEQGWALRFALDGKFLDFEGDEAYHTAHIVAPAVNVGGASSKATQEAVDEIETAGSATEYFRRVLDWGEKRHYQVTPLNEYPAPMRLAFEMASHEETERAALEEDLSQLEADWREAEEIASISDNMFLPQSITDFISRAKR